MLACLPAEFRPGVRVFLRQLAQRHAEGLAELERGYEKLRRQLHEERECAARTRRPEPFRVGAVIGIRGDGTQMVLQVIRTLVEYPDITIQVRL